MSKLWEVEFTANPFYLVEADTAEEAVNKALSWYEEYEPKISCALHSPEDDDEPCCADCDYKTGDGIPPDSHCFWCNEYSEFKKKDW